MGPHNKNIPWNSRLWAAVCFCGHKCCSDAQHLNVALCQVSVWVTGFSFSQELRVIVYMAFRMGSVRTETLKMEAHMLLSSPHLLKVPMNLTTDPRLYSHTEPWNWKGPWQCSSGIFPSLPLRGFSLLQDTSKGHSSRKKGVWGGAEQVGSCQLSSSFTQSNNSFNSCKQPGASFHFVWKGGSNVKKRFECTWSTCSLHLADERIEVQRSNLYWAC